MSWRQFELVMADAFRHQGYRVTVTPDGADGGVDLILERESERVLVQCKHWNAWEVGVKTVRELYGVVSVQGATRGVVAASGRYTRAARKFASQAGIELLDGRDVSRMLDALPPAIRAAHAAPSVGPQQLHGAPSPRCPRCGESMVMRTTQRGQNRGSSFWGCPRFPACRGFLGLDAASGQPRQQLHLKSLPPPPPRAVPARRGAARTGRKSERKGIGAFLGWSVLAIALALALPSIVPLLSSSLTGLARQENAQGQTVQPPMVTSTPLAEPTTSEAVSAPSQTDPAAGDERIVASIPLPARPHQVAVDPEGQRLYVTNRDAKSITVVDLTTNQVLAEFPLERQPLAIAFDGPSKTLWVTNYNDATVTVMDTAGSVTTTVSVGQGPSGIAIDSGQRRAFVANGIDKTVSVIDITTQTEIFTNYLGFEVAAGAVDPVMKELCLVQPMAMDMVYCYDDALKLAGVFGSVGDTLAIDSVTHNWYGADRRNKTLTAVAATTGVRTTIPLSHVPTAVAVDQTTHLVYVVLPDGNQVLVMRPIP